MMESDGLSTTRVSIAPLPPSLPTELWLLIISSVERKEDLLTLCCTSKQLRALSLPYAFKVVKLGHDMTRTYGQLILVHESLRRLDVSSAISDFRIRIWEPKCRQGKGNLCSVCDKQDGLVGETLLALVNLEALEVTCQLCRTNSDTSGKRHSYIQQLRTRRLRTFKFHCRMCFGADLDQREKILASPCLETVQIFSYGPDSSYPIHEQASAFMARPGVLQGVHTMQFYGTTLDGQILATRPIQRLHVRYWHTIELDKASRLSQALSESPGKLTYLTVEAGLLRIIGVLPTFKFLRHVGTFDVSFSMTRFAFLALNMKLQEY